MTEPTREQLDNLLDRAERHALTRAETDRLRAGFAALRADLEAADAETAEARDHNDRTCEAVKRRDVAEAAVQRVRDLHRPWVTVHGTHCNECSHLGVEGSTLTGRILDMPCPTLQALDAEPEPAADT